MHQRAPFDRITIEPGKLGGQPSIRGMRITVRRVLEILATYPDRVELFRENNRYRRQCSARRKGRGCSVIFTRDNMPPAPLGYHALICFVGETTGVNPESTSFFGLCLRECRTIPTRDGHGWSGPENAQVSTRFRLTRLFRPVFLRDVLDELGEVRRVRRGRARGFRRATRG